jgi:hypothetical protein
MGMNESLKREERGRRRRRRKYRSVGPGVVVGLVHLGVGPGVLAVGGPAGLVHVDGGLLIIPGLAEDDREPVGGGRVVHVPGAELGDCAASLHLNQSIQQRPFSCIINASSRYLFAIVKQDPCSMIN